MTTPLYPTFRKRIDDALHLLIQNQVTPWSFLTAGPPFNSKYFDGKGIHYQGIGFEGSPRDVFWGRYIEPYLEHLCVTEIASAVAMAKEKQVDGRALLTEIQGLLKSGTYKIFERMAEVDQRLLGKGCPNTVHRRPIENEQARMSQFIDEHIQAELLMWKSKSTLEQWYERNKFWVWATPIAATIVAALLKFL
jgi:hypothetical protein